MSTKETNGSRWQGGMEGGREGAGRWSKQPACDATPQPLALVLLSPLGNSIYSPNRYFQFSLNIVAPNVYFLYSLNIRVFHKNTFSKEKIAHTITTPYRAYINHTQKISFLGQA